MNKFVVLVLYILWVLSLAGILVVTFTRFQYEDINILAAVIFTFTILNTFFIIKRK